MAIPQFLNLLADIPPTSIEEQLILAQSLLIPCFIRSLNLAILLVGVLSAIKFALTFHWKALK